MVIAVDDGLYCSGPNVSDYYGCLIGRCFGRSEDRPNAVTTLLSRVSLVPLLILKRLRLDSNFRIPNSGPLLP